MESKLLDNDELIYLKDKSIFVRKQIVKMILGRKSGHPGGSLSCVEILTILYKKILNLQVNKPNWSERDRFILSKGHAAPALYSILCDAGFFPIDELSKFRGNSTMLKGHPSISTPGVDASSGSLGMGLSIGIGLSLAAKSRDAKYKTYVLIGDGELNEGQVWEAAMAASHFKLDNLITIIDSNKLQLDGSIDEIMKNNNLRNKWEAFGWEVLEVNGHDYQELFVAFSKEIILGKPRCIIANTIKGKGIYFMENNPEWHSVRQVDNAENDLINSLNCLNGK